MQDSKAIGGLVDLVDRQFTAPEPDQLWVGDITYIWTYSGFAYLATLIDMCSNKVVGWAVDDHMRTGLVLEAVDNALAARGPGIVIGGLVVHHDRGSQYTSGRYRDRLFAEGIIPSVGHTGICYDNAAAESTPIATISPGRRRRAGRTPATWFRPRAGATNPATWP